MADAILSPEEMKAVEKAAFEDGIEAEKLMDSAGEGIAEAILELERPGVCVLYSGKGTMEATLSLPASLLAKAGWEIWARFWVSEKDLQPLPKKKLQDLETYRVVGPLTELPKNRPRVILDGLLGLGSRSGLNASLRVLTQEINALRLGTNATVYAIDLPTGLGEEGADPDAVLADFTLTIGFPKTPLFQDKVTSLVGRILVIDLPELSARRLSKSIGPSCPDPLISAAWSRAVRLIRTRVILAGSES